MYMIPLVHFDLHKLLVNILFDSLVAVARVLLSRDV